MAVMTGATLGMGGSYNSNSTSQMVAIEASITYIREAINELDISSSCAPIVIADYGAAHALNSMYAMKAILQYLKESTKIEQHQQVLVVHNDLPTNDWTTLFELVNKDNSYYGVASGRSFYEQCLPMNSLSIGYSSSSLQWLSRNPCNLSNHCASLYSEGEERLAFQKQAHLDFAQFLEHRSRELHVGGVLIVIIWCTGEQGLSGSEQIYNLLYKCAQTLFTQQELLDYTIPFYVRSPVECADFDLFRRCSFKLINSVLKETETPLYRQYLEGQITLDEFARTYTRFVCSYSESALRQALVINGRSAGDIETALNQFWTLYEQQVKERPHECHTKTVRNYLVLKKYQ